VDARADLDAERNREARIQLEAEADETGSATLNRSPLRTSSTSVGAKSARSENDSSV
jgi:hypothetical protein